MEEEILSRVKRKYPQAYRNHDYKYDIMVPENGLSIEVKYDKESEKTGNYFIETGCDGVESGLSCSWADYYAIVDNSNIVWINTESLKYLLRDFVEREFSREGHIWKGYLLPKHILINSQYAIIKDL